MMLRRVTSFLLILLSDIFHGATAIWFGGIFGTDSPAPTSESPTTPAPTSFRPTAARPTAPSQPTTPSTLAPNPAPSTTSSEETAAPTPTPAPTLNNDLFTILVVSDIENKWRGHSIDRSRYVAQYIRNVRYQKLTFDDEYSDYPIDPQLIINTGDISHYWGCHNPNYLSLFGACRQPDDEFLDIWQQIYDAGIPMIATYGNHDWKPAIGTGNPYKGTPNNQRDVETDNINQWSSEFVHKTYQKAAAMGEIQFEEIPPTGAIGQSMYRSTFRGLQLASFGAAYNWQSYDDSGIFAADDQFQRLADTLNQSVPTLFFSHFPLSAGRLVGQTPTKEETVALIQQFSTGSHHFAGHYHAALIEQYDGFSDYIVPYPHTWGNREPGYLAVLVSPQEGVLQVKLLTIPGLEDGTTCLPVNLLTVSNYITPRLRPSQTLHQRLENWLGFTGLENGCDRCKAGRQYWSSTRVGWVCGEEPDHNTIVWDDEDLPLDSLDQAELKGEDPE